MLFFRKPCLGGFGLGFELPLIFQSRRWDKLAVLGTVYQLAQQTDWVANDSPVSKSSNFVENLLAIRERTILQDLHCRRLHCATKNGWPFQFVMTYYLMFIARVAGSSRFNDGSWWLG